MVELLAESRDGRQLLLAARESWPASVPKWSLKALDPPHGHASGAGVDDHIHTHIVPRWGGDTNFMPVMADVRVLPEALAESYEKLRGKF